MYNELWKKSNIIESGIKNSIELMNLTRKEIKDIKQKTTNPNNQNDGIFFNFYILYNLILCVNIMKHTNIFRHAKKFL